MNEYVDAIRSNSMAGLRRKYREIDVLLIDDVQFLEGKEGLQEEFFHTFNSLHGANKQIVISSDRMPDAIPTLEERLRGRFKWGLITDIQPPDSRPASRSCATRPNASGSRCPPRRSSSSPRRSPRTSASSKGALIRVTAYASLSGEPITTELAQQQLADLLTDTEPKPRTDAELLDEIAGDPRLRGRGAEGQEPSTAARHRTPDRDVRVPRGHRPELPEHRPAVRWAATTRPSSTRSRRSNARWASARRSTSRSPTCCRG